MIKDLGIRYNQSMKSDEITDEITSLHDILVKYCSLLTDANSESNVVMELANKYGIQEIVSEIEQILLDGSLEDIRNVLTFLRDCTLFREYQAEFTPTVRLFREAIPKSQILKMMYKNLSLPEISIRGWTIYSLGKMGFKESAAHLRDVIPTYVKESSDLLFNLLFEIFWLEENTDYDLLKDLVKLKKTEVNESIRRYFEGSKREDPTEVQQRDEILSLMNVKS